MRIKDKIADKIIVHCTFTPPDMDIGFKEIDQWHKARSWKGCGYHYIIRRDGNIETGRPLGTMGAHARGYNSCPGIVLVGGAKRIDGGLTNECNFTNYQYSSLEMLVDMIRSKPQVHDDAEVIGHCDLPNTDKPCPNFNVRAFFYQALPLV